MGPFCPNKQDESKLQQSTQNHFTTLLEDFNEFEKTFLPPYSVDDIDLDLIDWDFTEKFQDTEVVLEGNPLEGHIVTEDKADATTTVEVMSCGGDDIHGGGRRAEWGSLNSGSTVGSSSGMNARRQVGTNVMHRAPRRRSKCKNATETAIKLEQMKIKNRISAAQSWAKKQAHTYQLQQLKQRFYAENELLKKLLMFLQGTLKMGMTRKQLRRTISGPT